MPSHDQDTVAEDSTTQAAQIRGLLEEANYEVDVVGNGKERFNGCEQRGPGFGAHRHGDARHGRPAAGRAIRVHYSDIPVILMTSQGTDAIAIESLEDGAAGYVPKSQVSLRLVDEIAQVLHVSQVNRSYERLLGCLTQRILVPVEQ